MKHQGRGRVNVLSSVVNVLIVYICKTFMEGREVFR